MTQTSPTAKKFILRRDGAACRYCGVRVYVDAPEDTRYRLTLDHLWPESKDGSNGIFNLVVACWACNHAKKQDSPTAAWAPLPPPEQPPNLIPWGEIPLTTHSIVRLDRERISVPFISRQELGDRSGRLGSTPQEQLAMLQHRKV